MLPKRLEVAVEVFEHARLLLGVVSLRAIGTGSGGHVGTRSRRDASGVWARVVQTQSVGSFHSITSWGGRLGSGDGGPFGVRQGRAMGVTVVFVSGGSG